MWNEVIKMIRLKISKLLVTVLSCAALLTNQWEGKTITQDVFDGSELLGQVRLPDWDVITFEDFPSVTQDGILGSEYNSYVDYDLSRQWFAGDSVVDILKLGDLEEAFAIQEFSVGDILSIAGEDAEDISLESFGLVKDQTLQKLKLSRISFN